jgi:hypothetical protein
MREFKDAKAADLNESPQSIWRRNRQPILPCPDHDPIIGDKPK